MAAALTATMSRSSNAVTSTNHPRINSARAFTSSSSHHTPHRSTARRANENDAAGLDELYWDNEDDSFEVPDFHFDWGVAKEKEKIRAEMGSGVEDNLQALVLDQTGKGIVRHLPPSVPYPGKNDGTPPSRLPHSPQSSASSGHILSLTDASSASASSLFPTPPNPSVPTKSHSASSQASGSSDSSSGRPGRTYGGRSFQRVVSAPLTRQRCEDGHQRADTDDKSVSNRARCHLGTNA